MCAVLRFNVYLWKNEDKKKKFSFKNIFEIF